MKIDHDVIAGRKSASGVFTQSVRRKMHLTQNKNHAFGMGQDSELRLLGKQLLAMASREQRLNVLSRSDDEMRKLSESLSNEIGDLIDRIWSIKPTTMDGVKVYAEVARYWFADRDFDEVDSFGLRAVQNLIKSILDGDRPTKLDSAAARVTIEMEAA